MPASEISCCKAPLLAGGAGCRHWNTGTVLLVLVRGTQTAHWNISAQQQLWAMLLLSSSPALLRCIPEPPQGWSALHFSWCWAAEMFYPLCSIKASGSCEGIHLSLMFICFSGNCALGTALLAGTVLALTGRVGGFGCELTSVTLIFCLALNSDFSRVQVWRWWVKGGLLFWWWDSSDELQCVSLLHKGAAKFNVP